jgi:MFS family permease
MSTEFRVGPPETPPEAREQTRKVIRLSYVQAMVAAIYVASTGGMFIIGFARMLGQGNPDDCLTDDRMFVLIGLMSTFPMLCVVGQLLSALMVERGVSRRGLTFYAALVNVLLWPSVILIPFVSDHLELSSEQKLYALIALITGITFFGHLANNARASWVGDLIPGRFRGPFFGKMAMFASIVATVFAVVEGRFLDYIKDHGLSAFSLLFVFGMIFGLINALLFRPQHDIPIERDQRVSFRDMLLQALRNKPLLATMGFMLVFMMQTVAGPFYVTYMLGMELGFFDIGLINAVLALAMILSSPLWGRIVQRVGCRPVLILCVLILGCLQFMWLVVDTPWKTYVFIMPCNAVAGVVIGGISVAMNTLIYKVTPVVGRSVQLAIYSITVTMIAAPMPWLGGHLPGTLKRMGIESADLRWTFYAAGVICLIASVAGRLIREDDARPVRDLMKYILGGGPFRKAKH